MALPPILYHHFALPLPYARTWLAQEQIHNIQLRLRRASSQPDILLLLQHRPTYTSGRRQTEPSIQRERSRLTAIGADFVAATRGGQLTYHGPGQVVGYPLLDLSRYTPTMGARDYVCRIQRSLQNYLHHSQGITHSPSEHTGVFLDPTTKIASIGVQVRHRLTSHGFAINITSEPIPWFNQIIACGLDDVTAGSVESKTCTPVRVEDEIPALVHSFGQVFQRDMVRMDLGQGSEVGRILLELEKEAQRAGSWFAAPNRIDSE